MFQINKEDMSIYATRGDVVVFNVTADDGGKNYKFQPGEVVRIKVYGKKDVKNVVLQKDFPVLDYTESVEITLTRDDMKIGEPISKPTDYWYEIELNPFDIPQTIIGYDDDGPVLFRLFPEGDDAEEYKPDPKDFPIVDEELDMTSPRPIANQAIARAYQNLLAGYERTHAAVSKLHVTPEMFGAIGDGEADDTEALEKAIATDCALKLIGEYRVSNITLPKRLYGHGKISGNITIDKDESYIEDVIFSGKINFNARNTRIMNCDFVECEFNLNKWANSFINCSFYKSPIFFEIELSATNNFVNCYFSSANQFWGTPSNIHITGGWIEECTNVFNLGETSNVFGVMIENCDIESCTNIIKLRGNVLITQMLFSKCVILGNSKTTYILNTDESSEVTNDVSVAFTGCLLERVKDFASIKNTNCGIEGLPQSIYTKNVTYDTAANVSWNVRSPLHTAMIPDFDVEHISGTEYKVNFRKPIFVGEVTCSTAESITANRCVNGAFVTTTRTGATGIFNSTCFSLIISASSKPTVTITTSGEI